MSNPDFGKFAGPKSRADSAPAQNPCRALPSNPGASEAATFPGSCPVPSPEAFPSPLAGEEPGVRGIVPRVPSRVPLDSSVPSRHGVGQLLRWVSYLLNQSVPTHRPFCDRSPVQSQRVPSHPSLSPARCGWVQAKRRRTGGDRQFPRAFLVETTCPVPVSRSRRRPDACRSVGRLWTLDLGHWTRTTVSRPVLFSSHPLRMGPGQTPSSWG
jgi:hypothetical protein